MAVAVAAAVPAMPVVAVVRVDVGAADLDDGAMSVVAAPAVAGSVVVGGSVTMRVAGAVVTVSLVVVGSVVVGSAGGKQGDVGYVFFPSMVV